MKPLQTSPAERRALARIPSSIPAVVHTSTGASYGARIANFCLNGMLLRFEQPMAAPLRPGSTLSVDFDPRLDDAPATVSIPAMVRHAQHDAVGVEFTSLSAEHRTLLQALAARAAEDRTLGWGRRNREVSGSLLERIHRVAREVWEDSGEAVLKEALKAAVDESFQRADAMRDEQDKARLLSDLHALEMVRNRRDLHDLIELAALAHIGRSVTVTAPAAPADKPAALSLVDKEEVEDWLAKEALANRIHQEHEEILGRLESRLKPMLPEGAAIPLGAESLAGILHDLLTEAGLSDEERRRLLWTLGRPLAQRVGPLYEAFLQALDAAGVEPPAKEPGPLPEKPEPGRTPSAPAHPATHPPAPAAETPMGTEADPPTAGTGQPAAEPSPMATPSASATFTPIHGDASHSPAPVASPLHRHDEPPPSARSGAPIGRQVPEQAADRTGGKTRISARTAQATDLLEQMKGGMSDEHVVTSPRAREWMSRLIPRLGEALFTDPAFLSCTSHPLREIVDRLDRLGTWTQSAKNPEDRNTARQVESLISSALARPIMNLDDWKRLSRTLADIERRQLRKYAPDFTGAVLRSLARQRAEAAERAVAARLGAHFAGRRVHRLVANLLDSGWAALLATIHLEEGPDSPAWLNAWERMETLEGLLAEAPEARTPIRPESRDALLEGLSAGLSRVALDPQAAAELLRAIGRTLASEHDRTAVLRSDQFVEYTPPAAPPKHRAEPPEGWTTTEWHQQLDRLRALAPGTTVRVRDRKGRTHDLQVAWVAPEGKRFVCLDHSSGKVRNLTLEDLARIALRDSEFQVTAFDQPLAERLSQHIAERLQRRICEQASRDPLTRLRNRRYMMKKLRRVTEQAQPAVFCLLDLDKFTVVNGAYGYEAGDLLLREVARKLRAEFGEQATISRVGSDEFALLFAERADEKSAEALGNAVLEAVRGIDFRWEGKPISIQASIGVAPVTDFEQMPDAIFNAADSARQVAKNLGGGRVRVYREDDTQIARHQRVSHWIVRIRDIIAHDRLRLRRQKILPLQADGDQRPRYEVLLSARDEHGARIPVSEFVYAAERCNAMPDVDRWVIQRTFEWLAANRRDDDAAYHALNLSGQSLQDPKLAEFIVEQFEKTGAPPNKVAFEVTETAAMERLEEAARMIQTLRDLGCSVALDDFGTGLSSYAYLHTLPVDMIKIDGWFVQRMGEHESDLALVRSVNELAHFIGKETVAEGVETAAIHAQLVELGVDFAQGYWIERPAYFA